MMIKRKSKILSNLFLGISFILQFIFMVMLLSSILVGLVSRDAYGSKIALIEFIVAIVILLPISFLFYLLSEAFDPEHTTYTHIDPRDPPYKDWY